MARRLTALTALEASIDDARWPLPASLRSLRICPGLRFDAWQPAQRAGRSSRPARGRRRLCIALARLPRLRTLSIARDHEPEWSHKVREEWQWHWCVPCLQQSATLTCTPK